MGSEPGLLCAKLLHRGMRGQKAGKVLRTDSWMENSFGSTIFIKCSLYRFSSNPTWYPKEEITFKDVLYSHPIAPNGFQILRVHLPLPWTNKRKIPGPETPIFYIMQKANMWWMHNHLRRWEIINRTGNDD